MEFNGKTALITGAAAGIGRAAAILFAERGANVVLLDVNQEKLTALEETLDAYAERVLTCRCDISDVNAVQQSVDAAIAKFQKIDILVNNAALWRCSGDLFVHASLDEWKKYMDINVMGTVYVTKAVIGGMLANGYGRIINVASVAGVYGNANMVQYSASKGAVISFTRALAKEVADQGITVNAISPGSVSPAEKEDIDYVQPSELCFMKRTGSGRENAELICFLASDAAAYISGQNIQIDGCRKKQ